MRTAIPMMYSSASWLTTQPPNMLTLFVPLKHLSQQACCAANATATTSFLPIPLAAKLFLPMRSMTMYDGCLNLTVCPRLRDLSLAFDGVVNDFASKFSGVSDKSKAVVNNDHKHAPRHTGSTERSHWSSCNVFDYPSFAMQHGKLRNWTVCILEGHTRS